MLENFPGRAFKSVAFELSMPAWLNRDDRVSPLGYLSNCVASVQLVMSVGIRRKVISVLGGSQCIA